MNFVARVNNLLMKVSLKGDDVLEGAALMNGCIEIYNFLNEEENGNTEEVHKGTSGEG